MSIEFRRIWAMPNARTFSIKPISELLDRRVSGYSIDPFSNLARRATVTNDIDPVYGCDYSLEALEFFALFRTGDVDCVLFDPPYSPRQVSECYTKVGRTVTAKDTSAAFWANAKKEVSRVTKTGGIALSFGWNSGGIGKKYGFEIIEILLVPHGGAHNDTICTVEQKK